MSIAQLKAEVLHQRIRPLAHTLRTSTTWFEVDLNVADQLSWLDTFPFTFRSKDHGLLTLKAQNCLDSIKQYALSQKLSWPQKARVLLYAQPSFLGYNFNPISLYLIFNESKIPIYVLAEVSNTYREQKIYVLKEGHQLGQFELETPKNFYISPFISVQGSLKIIVRWQEEKLFAQVLSFEEDQLTLTASMQGLITPSTLLSRLKALAVHPTLALRVMMLIHWHALVLYLKGIPYFSKSKDLQFQKDIFHAENHVIHKNE